MKTQIASIRQWVSDLLTTVDNLWKKVSSIDGITGLAKDAASAVGNGAASLASSAGALVSDAASSAWGSIKETFGFRQNVTATTTINVQGKADQATINEIGRVTERSVRGAASEAAKR